jgi:hypothetical protein
VVEVLTAVEQGSSRKSMSSVIPVWNTTWHSKEGAIKQLQELQAQPSLLNAQA